MSHPSGVHRLASGLAGIFLGVTLLGCQSNPTDPLGSVLRPAKVQEHPEYTALGGHKAQAVSYAIDQTNLPSAWFNHVAEQNTPVMAAMRALTDCEQARAQRLADSEACELRRRGDKVIHSGRELKEGLATRRDALIWRVSDDATTAYVAGSIHVLKSTIDIPQSYRDAFALADVLVLELDRRAASQAEVAQLVLRMGMLPNGQTLDDVLPPADMERVNAYVTELGIPTEMITRMQPAMLLLQASALEYMAMGYQGELGVESVFEAQKGNLPIIGLETMEAQLQAATALPIELQAQLLLETLSELDNSTQEISELIRVWLSGDAQALDQIFNQGATDSPAAQQWLDDLLTKRNIGMAEGITTLLRTSLYKQPFVLVGAAHLVGDNSVIALLEQQGFAVTQLKNYAL